MWLIPFVDGNNHYLYIEFVKEVVISCIKIWNYNKSKDDALRGVKLITILADNVMITSN